MLSGAEIARGVQGALGFLRRDPAAPLAFANTMEACLRSFRVMVLVAPFYVIHSLIRYADADVPADTIDIVIVEAISYVVNWLLFPVLFYEIARRRGWLDRYPRYIGALNWISLPATLIAVVGIAAEIVTPVAVARLIEIALQALIFYWFLMTTRMVLGTDWLISMVLLVVNWVPSILLSVIVARYVGAFGVTGI
ncbi:MAG: hypothetical protein ISP49_02350 [Reyranella sp.]|nr:hypothetical protein [Reyranella sp.]MBL6650402.1 hypothetical protein [Reyranella sp.]